MATDSRARRLTVASAIALVALSAAGCGGARRVAIQVTPALSLEDQPISIAVTGLAPHQSLVLTMRSTDDRGVRFSAQDTYCADAGGTVALSTSAPAAGGSYGGRWQMGLLTSMLPSSAPPFYDYIWGERVHEFVLTASSHGRTVARTTFRRRLWNGRTRDVALTVAHDGIAGAFSAPRQSARRPAVLFLGGSEGGIPGLGGPRLLASHGLPTLQLGYFHGTGLPDRLVNIPLEYFRRALEWLRRQPEVDPARITVLGISYGSEAALLAGARFPTLVRQVVALVPSSVVTCGILGARRAYGPSCLGSPWSLNGRPLPHTTLIDTPTPWDTPAAVIPVQRIRGPVFLVCGTADEEWSSCAYARAIRDARARAHETTVFFEFRGATHSVGTPIVYAPGSLASELFTATERDRETYYGPLLRFLAQ